MEFFNKTEDSIYNITSSKGLYPITKQGLWHSGLHIYCENNVQSPISASYVCSNIFDKEDYDSNYLILKKTECYKKNNENENFTYYILFNNLQTKKNFQNFISEKNKFQFINQKKELKKLLQKPFCYNFKFTIQNINGNNQYYDQILYNGQTYNLDFESINLINADWYSSKELNIAYLKKDTEIFSLNNICMGKIKKDKHLISIKEDNKILETDEQKNTIGYYKINLSQQEIELDETKKIEGFYFKEPNVNKTTVAPIGFDLVGKKNEINPIIYTQNDKKIIWMGELLHLIINKDDINILEKTFSFSLDLNFKDLIKNIKKNLENTHRILLLPTTNYYKNKSYKRNTNYYINKYIDNKSFSLLTDVKIDDNINNEENIVDFAMGTQESKIITQLCDIKYFFQITFILANNSNKIYIKEDTNTYKDYPEISGFRVQIEELTSSKNTKELSQKELKKLPKNETEYEHYCLKSLLDFITRKNSKHFLHMTIYDKISLKNKYEIFYDKLEINEQKTPDLYKKKDCYYVKTTCYNTIGFDIKIKSDDAYFVKITGEFNPTENLSISNYYKNYIFPNSNIAGIYESNTAQIPYSGKIRKVNNNETFELINYNEIINSYLNNKPEYVLNVKYDNSKNGIIFIKKEQLEKLYFYLDKSQEPNDGAINKNDYLGFCNNFFDFATFSIKSFNELKINANKITVKEKIKCLIEAPFKEKKNILNITEKFFLPLHSTVEYENKGDYILVKSITIPIFIYNTINNNKNVEYINNDEKKAKVTNTLTKRIYLWDKKIEYNSGIFTSSSFLTEDDIEKILILNLSNQIFLKLLVTPSLNFVCYENKQIKYTTNVKIEYLNTYIKKSDYENWFKNKNTTSKFIDQYIQDGDIKTPGYFEVDYPFKEKYEELDYTQKKEIPEKKIANLKYREFSFNKQKYFIKESDISINHTNIAAEINSLFDKANYGDKFSDSNIFPEEQIYFSQKESTDINKLEKYPELKKALKDYVKQTDSSYENLIGNTAYIYNMGNDSTNLDCKNYQVLLRHCFKKFSSKHPIEFDKEVIDKANAERTDLKGENNPNKLVFNEKTDNIYDKLKNKESISKNSFYFFCAPYLLNVLEKYKPQEINPYSGLAPRAPRFWPEQGNIIFNDNPGFIPYRTSSLEYKYLDNDLHQGDYYYPEINVGFNTLTDASYGEHMGIDFPGNKGDKIKALVHGVVWACTYDKTINEGVSSGCGRVMVIKGDDNLMYLLCHLSGYLKEPGEEVFPNDDVALVGNTGNSTGPHLHLEVHKTVIQGSNYNIRDNLLILENKKGEKYNNKEPNEGPGLTWIENYIGSIRLRVNPFNHGEKYVKD